MIEHLENFLNNTLALAYIFLICRLRSKSLFLMEMVVPRYVLLKVQFPQQLFKRHNIKIYTHLTSTLMFWQEKQPPDAVIVSNFYLFIAVRVKLYLKYSREMLSGPDDLPDSNSLINFEVTLLLTIIFSLN